MDGLERIKTQIIAEAKAKAEKIVAQAERYREEQDAAAKAKGEELLTEARARAEKEAERLTARMASFADAAKKRAALKARQTQIQICLEEAVERLKQAPAKERVARYAKMLEGSDLDGGEILLSERDQPLMPALVEALGKRFVASDEVAPIMGGVLLRKGLIMENHSYDLSLRNRRTELSRLAASMLFPEG